MYAVQRWDSSETAVFYLRGSRLFPKVQERKMANNSNFSIAIVAVASFVGGVAVGMLLAPKSGRENREWLKHKGGEVKGWISEKGAEVIHKAEEKFVHLKESIPDLYAATEDLHLKENDVVG